eukprot:1177549-Prorocentrum_minimum.AAC.2
MAFDFMSLHSEIPKSPIMAVESQLVLRNVTVENCTGFYGGALYSQNSVLRIEGSIFRNNFAEGDRRLPMPWVEHLHTWDTFGTWAPGVGIGGGAAIVNSAAEVVDSVFSHNAAATAGGGIALVHNIADTVCR